jgi:hypothetical protein
MEIQLLAGKKGDTVKYLDGSSSVVSSSVCRRVIWQNLGFTCVNGAWALDAAATFNGMNLCVAGVNDKQPGMSFHAD